jgi:hypothetical protein
MMSKESQSDFQNRLLLLYRTGITSESNRRLRLRQQAIPLVSQQFCVTDHPSRMSPPARLPLLGANATKACPLPYRKGTLINELGKLVDLIKVFNKLPFDQYRMHLFHPNKPFIAFYISHR